MPTNQEYCISNIDGLVANSASIVATPGVAVSRGSAGGCNIDAGVPVSQNVGAWVEVLYTSSTSYAPSTALPSVTFYSIYPENAGTNTAYGGSAYSKTPNTDGSFNLTHNQGELLSPGGRSLEGTSGILQGVWHPPQHRTQGASFEHNFKHDRSRH